MQPTGQPTMQPTGQPSMQPTGQPTGQPSAQPSGQPSGQPTRQPTGQPTGQPSSEPTNPTGQPTSQPSGQPTAQPSSQPTNPTSYPTSAYYLFDAYEEYKKYLTTSSRAKESAVKFGIYANKESDYNKFATDWDSFIESDVNSPFDMDYYEMGVYTSLVTFDCLTIGSHATSGCSEPYEKEFVCTDPVKTNFMAKQMIDKRPFRINCGGYPWGYTADGLFCVNCNNNTAADIKSRCAAHSGKALIPANLDCQPLIEKTQVFNVTRFTTIFTLKQNLIIYESVPKIAKVHLIPGRTDAQVVLNTTCVYPGCVISCLALPKDTLLSSARLVLSAGTKRSFSTSNLNPRHYSNLTVSLPLNSLVPIESYDMYCYGTDTLGHPSSLSMVLATKKPFQTVCCKDVLFDHVPAFIYADTSKYENAGPDQYTITFSISKKPKSSLTINPMLEMYQKGPNNNKLSFTDKSAEANSTLSTLRIAPSNFTFRSTDVDTDTSLQGNFVIISRFKETAGFINLRLHVSGIDEAEFGTDSRDFELLSSFSAPLPPSLLGVTFDASGTGAIVQFDSNTDLATSSSAYMATKPSKWACSEVLGFPGAVLTSCSWLLASQIKIVFPPLANGGVTNSLGVLTPVTLLVPGDSVTLIASKVRAQCVPGTQCDLYSFAEASIKTSVSPKTVQVPSIVWNVPSEIGFCENVTVDATGSTGNGGRPWVQVLFSVSTATKASARDTTLPSIQKLLDKITSIQSTMLVPGTLLNESLTYVFKLQMTNYLGAASSGSVSVRRSLSTSKPKVAFLGSTNRDMKASDQLSLQVMGSAPGCDSAPAVNTKYSYKWLVYKGTKYDSSIVSQSIDPTKMVVHANKLESGQSYRFTAIVITPAGIRANASTDVIVLKGVVAARIRGGSKQTAPIDRSLKLDGSTSIDLNDLAAVDPLLFKWTCTYTSMSKFGKSCDEDIFHNSPVVTKNATSGKDIVNFIPATGRNRVVTNVSTLTLPAHRMLMNETYKFELVCTAKSDGRSGVSAIVIQASAPGAPTVVLSVNPLGASAANLSKNKFNIGQKIILNGKILGSSNVDAKWSVSPDPISALSSVALMPVQVSLPRSSVAAGETVTLGVSGEFFSAGRSYTFKLTATNSHIPFTETSPYSEIIINMNTPPVAGIVTVTPTEGSALLSRFKAFTSPFSDDDIPVLYKFFYYIDPNLTDVGVLGASFNERTFVETSFPQGNKDYGDRVIVGVIGQDSLGAQTGSQTTIQVHTFVVAATKIVVSNRTIAPTPAPGAPTAAPIQAEADGGLSAEVQSVISDTLADMLAVSAQTGNTDVAAQVIDVVAGMLNNAIDCNVAPTAQECKDMYHRNSCLGTANVCGACLESDGYYGLEGDGMTVCRRITPTLRRLSADTYSKKYLWGDQVSSGQTFRNGPHSNPLPVASFAAAYTSVSSTKEYFSQYKNILCTESEGCGWGDCVKTAINPKNGSKPEVYSASGVCKPYMKSCSSSIPGRICSGRGQCVFFESSGKPVHECLATNTNCYSYCACHNGYTGVDCNIKASTFAATEAIRVTLCTALTDSASKQDKSADSLDALAASLSRVINELELSASPAMEACLEPLKKLLSLAAEGFIAGTRTAASNLVLSLSKMTEVMKRRDAYVRYVTLMNGYKGPQSGITTEAGVLSTEAFEKTAWENALSRYESPTALKPFKHHLNSNNPYHNLQTENILKSLILAIHKDMIPGESSRSLITDNIKISIFYERETNLKGRVLSVPQSSPEKLYRRSVPSIAFPGNGMKTCRINWNNQSEFLMISLTSLEYVPFDNSDRLVSSLLRYSALIPAAVVALGAKSDPIIFNETDPSFRYDHGHEGSYSAYGRAATVGNSSSNDEKKILARGVLCRGFKCYSNVSETYEIQLPFHRSQEWSTIDPLAYVQDHRAQLEYDVQTAPVCAFRDPRGSANNKEIYKLCLTHAQSSYTKTQANYKMVTLSDLCPFTSAPKLSQSDRGADATVYDGLHHFGAAFDQRTFMMYMEAEYVTSQTAFVSFTSVVFFFIICAWYMVRWDWKDQEFLRKYLHRDLKKYGQKNDVLLLQHINALVNSVGIKNKYGQDFEGDSDDDDEYEVWKKRANEIHAKSEEKNGHKLHQHQHREHKHHPGGAVTAFLGSRQSTVSTSIDRKEFQQYSSSAQAAGSGNSNDEIAWDTSPQACEASSTSPQRYAANVPNIQSPLALHWDSESISSSSSADSDGDSVSSNNSLAERSGKKSKISSNQSDESTENVRVREHALAVELILDSDEESEDFIPRPKAGNLVGLRVNSADSFATKSHGGDLTFCLGGDSYKDEIKKMQRDSESKINSSDSSTDSNDDSESTYSDKSAESRESKLSMNSSQSGQSEATGQGLADYVELDGFHHEIREKVNCFLAQALYLNGAVYKSRKRVNFVDIYTIITSILPLHEFSRMFSNVRTFIHTRMYDYTLMITRILFIFVTCSAFYSYLYASDYYCERKVNNLYSQLDSNYLAVNQTQQEKCLTGKPQVLGDLPYIDFPSECEWNQRNASCVRRSPPDIYFWYLGSALCLTLFSNLCDRFITSLLNVCFSRPRLEDIGLDTLRWFGPLCASMPSTKSGEIASTLIGTLLKDIRAHTLLGPSPNRPEPEGLGEEEEEPVINKSTFTAEEHHALAFMADREENDKIMEGAATIAEMMRKLRSKLHELESRKEEEVDELEEDVACSKYDLTMKQMENGSMGMSVQKKSIKRKPWEKKVIYRHSKNEFGGHDYDSRFDESELNEKIGNFSENDDMISQEEITKTIQSSNAIMMARYCYYDTLTPKEEIDDLLADMKLLYESQLSRITYLKHLTEWYKRKKVCSNRSFHPGDWVNKLRRMVGQRKNIAVGDLKCLSSFYASMQQLEVMCADGSPYYQHRVILPSPLLLLSSLPFPFPLSVRVIVKAVNSFFEFFAFCKRCCRTFGNPSGESNHLAECSDAAEAHLIQLLQKSRIQTTAIVKDICSYAGKASIHDDIQDMRLLQHFILEQIPSATLRFAINRVFTQAVLELKSLSSDSNFHSVRFLPWFMANLFLFGFWIGAIAFVIKWFFYNNQVALRAWIFTSGIAIGSDIFIYKTAEVYLIQLLAFDNIKPQLKIVMKLFREILYSKFRSLPNLMESMNPGNFTEDFTDKENKHAIDLRTIQHTSAACRAARHFSLSHLPAAQLLMRVDDVDALMLKKALCGDSDANINLASTTSATYCARTDDVESLFNFFWRRLSPLSQDFVFTLFITMSIPVAWTGLILLGNYLNNDYPQFYYYVGYACGVYVFFGYFLIYPAHQRVRAFAKANVAIQLLRRKKANNELKKEVADPRTKAPALTNTPVKKRKIKVKGCFGKKKWKGVSSAPVGTPQSLLWKCARFLGLVSKSLDKLSRIDRLFIWLGLVKGYSKQMNKETEIEQRFWAVQWAYRMQTDFSNVSFNRPATSPISLRARPKVVTLKLPLCLHILHFFTNNWEQKWGGVGKKPAKTVSTYIPEISPELRMQYLGGDYANLVELHSDTVAAILAKEEKKSKRNIVSRFIRRHTMRHMSQLIYEQNVQPIIDAQEARNYVILQFEERCHIYRAAHIGAYAGTGILPFPQLLQVSYKLFIRYKVDGIHHLLKPEWIQMADDLKTLTERHEGNTLSVTEYLCWLTDFVNEINVYRAKDRRHNMKKQGAPPSVGPAPLSIAATNIGIGKNLYDFQSEGSDDGFESGSDAESSHSHHDLRLHRKHIIEPTHNVREALQRLYDRFQLLDPLDTQILSASEAYHLAQWIWTVYSPAGEELHSAELEEMEEDLLMLIDKRSKILYPSYTDNNEMSECTSADSKQNSTMYMQYSYASPAGVISLKDILMWFHICDKRLRQRRAKGHSVAQSFRDEGHNLPQQQKQILKPGGSLYGHIKRAIVGPATPAVVSDFAQLDGTKLKLLPGAVVGSNAGTKGMKSRVIGGKVNKQGRYVVTNRTIVQAPVPMRLPFPLSAVEMPTITEELASMSHVSFLNTLTRPHIKAATHGILSTKLFPPEITNSAVMKVAPLSPADANTSKDRSPGVNQIAKYKVMPVIAEPTRGVKRSPQRLQSRLHVDLEVISDAGEEQHALQVDLNINTPLTNGSKVEEKSGATISKQTITSASVSASGSNSVSSTTSSLDFFFDFDNILGPDSDDENEANIRLAADRHDVVFKIPPNLLNKHGVRKLKDFARPRSHTSHHHYRSGGKQKLDGAQSVDPKTMTVKLDSDSDEEFFHKQLPQSKASAAATTTTNTNTNTTTTKNLCIEMKSPVSPHASLKSTKTNAAFGIDMTSPEPVRSAEALCISMRVSPIAMKYPSKKELINEEEMK